MKCTKCNGITLQANPEQCPFCHASSDKLVNEPLEISRSSLKDEISRRSRKGKPLRTITLIYAPNKIRYAVNLLFVIGLIVFIIGFFTLTTAVTTLIPSYSGSDWHTGVTYKYYNPFTDQISDYPIGGLGQWYGVWVPYVHAGQGYITWTLGETVYIVNTTAVLMLIIACTLFICCGLIAHFGYYRKARQYLKTNQRINTTKIKTVTS